MTTTAPASPTMDLRDRLAIPGSRLDDLNAFLLDPDARIVNDLLAVVARYGTPDEINRKAAEAGSLPALLDRVRETRPDYLGDLEWLEEQRERGVFVSVADYRRGRAGRPGRHDDLPRRHGRDAGGQRRSSTSPG